MSISIRLDATTEQTVRQYLQLERVFICERLNTRTVASVDSDFTVYRDYLKNDFTNVFWDS